VVCDPGSQCQNQGKQNSFWFMNKPKFNCPELRLSILATQVLPNLAMKNFDQPYFKGHGQILTSNKWTPNFLGTAKIWQKIWLVH